MTVNDLRMLTMTLGGTENAVKAVTSAAGAGFGGNMLSDIAETGTRMNELGMSSDDLVSTLSSLSGEPLKAMEALTNQAFSSTPRLSIISPRCPGRAKPVKRRRYFSRNTLMM
ncbi:hypothetical protein CMV60_23210 [Serratia marcescens]|nr:hypothetical protein CMV60_23210 [Serratia marcescens]